MSSTSQLQDVVDFADNPEPRCPCVLLVDTSTSMQGRRMEALNKGLQTFKNDVTKDSLASRRIELAIITFSSRVELVQNFIGIDRFVPPRLDASGVTRMGSGIERALDLTDSRKNIYKDHGISYYRPWIFMITDGQPEGEPDEVVQRATQRLRDSEAQKAVAFFAVGVEDANMSRLSQIAVRSPVKLNGLNFGEMFVWLSASMQAVSHSDFNDVMVGLPPVGWGHVSQ